MMNSKSQKIRILADAEAMSRAAAETMIGRISDCLQARDTYSIALSGGSTPKRLYSLLANETALRDQIPWERIHFFWGDERHVPPEHPDSNFRMAYDAMLSKVPIPAENIHRIHGEDPYANKVAEDYEHNMHTFFRLVKGRLPCFNCVLLGMGPDGHTASLFPGTTALQEHERLVVANWVEKFQAHRITMTAPVLNNADTIIFLVAGEEKAKVLHDVLERDQQPNQYPVQHIQPTHGRMIWILDQPAASRLTRYT
jgi:6-phosphogluconolactonase